MPANPDFRDLLSAFSAERVEYLLVGAHAVMFYGEPRFTKDMDLWVNNTADNIARLFRALALFGAPLEGVRAEDFLRSDLVYQIGVAPNRIDIITGMAGVAFPDAWGRRVASSYDGVPIHVIHRADLIKAKQASNRPQDRLDVERLQLNDSNGS